MAGALFLIDNVPLELDSRVRREAETLVKHGVGVQVVCPGDPGDPLHEVVNEIHVYRYRKPSFGGGLAAHLAEYATSVASQFVLSILVFIRHRFDVVHVANPPDLLWLIAAPYKAFGRHFIFDQHDLVPELFEVRYGKRFPRLYRTVAAMERISYRLADHVITTNMTCRRIAIDRGGVEPDKVTVVRNGPRLDVDFPPADPDPEVRRLGGVVVGYLGIMNEQDHVDVFLEMARIIRHDFGKKEIGFVMVGEGDAFPALKRLRRALGLEEVVLMTGRIPWPKVLSTMAATDVCVQPDPPTRFNDKLTMNKLMEYMAFGKATVAFDMPETRASGGDTIVYVNRFDARGLAEAVCELADNPRERLRIGGRARRRIEEVLAWEHQSRHLLDVYRRVVPDALEPRG
jgi:glycosyltransferase involved in cell wall biosynthesis